MDDWSTTKETRLFMLKANSLIFGIPLLILILITKYFGVE